MKGPAWPLKVEVRLSDLQRGSSDLQQAIVLLGLYAPSLQTLALALAWHQGIGQNLEPWSPMQRYPGVTRGHGRESTSRCRKPDIAEALKMRRHQKDSLQRMLANAGPTKIGGLESTRLPRMTVG